ncbi:DUF3307 domain-containing protein [Streptomyces sp. B1866]|uniref:DUF3307 domain-containing protein n=1 Tax=Streptomyces sp. B1866 TaxID=3075431 RepID=UPI002890D8C2|nr:DUF3307 domain-containing protein [Streptomyces sp. B1866]MDT3396317.1 DUF3307 domain-containing protein [Streptomyces sp. B1866]
MLLAALVAHLVGDFVLQSAWMAEEKTRRWWPAVVHGAVYALPFLFLTHSVPALVVIAGTHVVLDRYRAARFLVWARNQVAPAAWRPSWADVRDNHGSPSSVSPGLALALVIVADNTVHLLINATALERLG